MFRVMIRTGDGFMPTQWGNSTSHLESSREVFKGVPTFKQGVSALREACESYPYEHYRLVRA
ncbi:hypothetical protein PsPphi15_gp22 [Pseudomonas phage phi15]|uniref:Uncharacterized protein n=1 Tax=Pseudomonas phage phi15 TaxID=988656 RepID=F0V6Y3_9CAUD|nr:hypothetical protein PsPphi15_gp22 [Pseudomonas phage phi15]CBZ41995.1 hypothetical protein [Pseudomonas phage phi15]